MLDRVTNITYRTAGGGLVRSFAYSYDAAGLITQQVVTADGACVTNAYAYDGLGRLVAESRIQESGVSSESYTYDLAGNRLSVSSAVSVVNNTYTHNRLTAVSDGTSFAYDTAGNVTNIVSASSAPSARKLTWNAQRQLVSVSTNGVFAESYAYDALGRRVSTTDSGGTVFHVYDGDECVADVDASGNPLRSYLWGQGVDNLLAVTVFSPSATNTYYAVKDHLSSVHALIDESGQVVASFTYDAWGNPLSHFRTSELSNFRFLFQGREYSYATGLYFFRARLYEPRVGRWLSNDPIGISGGLNLYEFCGSDPVNFRDPNGRIALNLAAGGVGAFIGGGVGAIIGGLNGGWRGALRGGLAGAAGGFISGATFGAATAAGLVTGWGTGVAIGSGTGALGGLASGVVGETFDAIDGECETEFEGKKIFEAGGWGLLGGGFTGGVGGFAGEAFDDITAGAVGGFSEIYTSHVFPGAAETASGF